MPGTSNCYQMFHFPELHNHSDRKNANCFQTHLINYVRWFWNWGNKMLWMKWSWHLSEKATQSQWDNDKKLLYRHFFNVQQLWATIIICRAEYFKSWHKLLLLQRNRHPLQMSTTLPKFHWCIALELPTTNIHPPSNFQGWFLRQERMFLNVSLFITPYHTPLNKMLGLDKIITSIKWAIIKTYELTLCINTHSVSVDK